MLCRRFGLAVVIVACGWLPPAQAEDAVLLKYKPSKGGTQQYRQIQEMKQSQGLMGMKIENTMKQEAVQSRVVDSVAPDGTATFKIKTESRKMAAEFAGSKYEFDSKSSDRDTSSAVGASLTPLLERLTGSEYQLILTARGQVAEVKGYSELIADLLQGNPLAAQFGAADNKSAAATEQDNFVILSDKPVKTGDTWEVPFEFDLAMLGKMKGKMTYTYEGPDKVGTRKTARIGVTSEISVELNLDMGGAKVTGTLTSSKSTGTAQFDPEAGCLVSLKTAYTMAGQLTVEAGGMVIPVDNEQEQSAVLELVDKQP